MAVARANSSGAVAARDAAPIAAGAWRRAAGAAPRAGGNRGGVPRRHRA